ncbi:MAG TPA: MFS transporter [Lapillicoccus sp.]|nr:MFS transporter [Lapillicoccus sp.]
MTEDVERRTARPADDADWSPHPHRWRILSVSLLVGFMSLLDVSIVNVAIPSMQQGLDTSASAIQWVVSGYLLTFGLTLVAGGRLGDAYGRRRMMLLGLVGFIVSSAAVGFAPNVALVIVARLVQGAMGGLLTPQNSGLVQELFRGSERARAFGLFGATVSVSSAAGPVVGGLILAAAGPDNGWRYLFLVNVPIGLVGLVAVAKLVPRRLSSPQHVDSRIDVVGAVLLGLSVLCLLYPVVSVEAGERWTLLLLVGVPLFAWAFVRWERRLHELNRPPLLDIGLLRGLPGYTNGLLVGTTYFAGYTGILLVLSVYLQEGLGYSPLDAGFLLMPFAVGSAISSPLAGRIVPRLGRRLTVIALAVTMTGVCLLALLVAGRDPSGLAWVAVPVMFLTGLGGGAVVSPNISITLADVPPRMGGAAGGALQTGQRIGSAIGAAVLMTVYVSVQHSGTGLALRIALSTSLALLAVALLMALRALRHDDGRIDGEVNPSPPG